MINPSTRSTLIKWIGVLKFGLLFLILISSCQEVKAQTNTTVTLTLVKAPCNNDGILVATASDTFPPLVFYWFITGSSYLTDTVKKGLTDTLHNYNGGPVQVSLGYPIWNGTNYNQPAYAYTDGLPPFTYNVQTTPAVCPNLGTGTATILGGTPPYTVIWQNDTSNRIIATGNPANLPAGNYNVSITDSKGCSFGSIDKGFDSINIQYLTNINVEISTTDANCTNGTAKVLKVTGGVPPFSYKWNNGANTDSISGLVMGEYMVTLTDSLGCRSIDFTSIQQSININVNTSETDATCLQNNGSIIAFGSGGTPPYSYLWSNGTTIQTDANLMANFYEVTITDANDCIGTEYSYVFSSTPIQVTYSSTSSLCTAPTGTATLSVTGGAAPYTISWYTYPVQTGITATSLAEGIYSFEVIDAMGCVQTGSVHISPVSIIQGKITETEAVCTRANGLASAVVTNGTPPYTYKWNTGSTDLSINNLSPGYYECTITNSQGCSITKSAYVGSSSPLNVGLSATPASCIFSNNGSIAANTTNGTPPYIYNWSNGQTAAAVNNLPPGWYTVNITDAAGCVSNQWTDVSYNANNDSCYCTITGTVFNDLNNNCVQDAGEPGIQNIMVQCSPVGYTFTDANGNYSFIVPTGTYALSEVVQYYYPLALCQNNSITVNAVAAPGCTSTHNFANVISPIHDVQIVTTDFGSPIPGNTYTQQVLVQNNGTVTEPGIEMGYADDGQLAFTRVIPSLFIQQNAGSYPNWYSVLNTFPSLAPGAALEFDVNYNVPANIPLNTSVLFYDTASYTSPISNWLNDYTPWDNVNKYEATVVGSFDPNNKQATPQGITPHGFILTRDSVINYTIHFQNTGNYPAQKVVVVDTLSSNLDFTTLHPGYSNHPYTTTVSENGVATFTFSNINLSPYNFYYNSGPDQSIGYFTYSVHQKPNLLFGTEIKSPASIYFDYNAPVRTNAALNTITGALGINDIGKENDFSFTLYPNPANGNLSLVINTSETNSESKMIFYNLLGEVVKSQNLALQKGRNIITTNVNSLAAGMYFVEISDGQHSQVQKLSVMK